nr:protein AATF-like isoform X1 [Ipomoea batatas]
MESDLHTPVRLSSVGSVEVVSSCRLAVDLNSKVLVEAYRLDDSACHGRFGVTARTAPIVPNLTATQEVWDNVDGNSQLLDDSDFYQQLLKEFFETIDPMSSGANSIGYLVLFVTASAFLLDLLCGSTEQLTLEI